MGVVMQEDINAIEKYSTGEVAVHFVEGAHTDRHTYNTEVKDGKDNNINNNKE